MKTPLILHINSAGKFGQLALSRGGELLSEKTDDLPLQQSSLLNTHIRMVLEQAKVGIENLDAVSVISGPGSFTGLRIGVSTAKGICYGLSIPLLSVSVLDIQLHEMAQSGQNGNGFVACVSSGAKGWYIKGVDRNNTVKIKEGYYTNSEAEVFKKTFSDFMFKYDLSHIMAAEEKSLCAKSMVDLSVNKYYSGIFENLAYFEPNYISPFQSGKGTKSDGSINIL